MSGLFIYLKRKLQKHLHLGEKKIFTLSCKYVYNSIEIIELNLDDFLLLEYDKPLCPIHIMKSQKKKVRKDVYVSYPRF